MVSSILSPLLVLLCLSALCSLSTQNGIIDICDCDVIGSLSGDCDNNLQCDCKPGVGGLMCDQCMPGYIGFGTEGCSLDGQCQCHPGGSLSDECDNNGVCTCRLGILGDKCDTCQDGFHRIDLGCIPCPTCFNQVAIQFNATLVLYNNLLQRLNDSLSSNGTNNDGLSQELIDELARYEVLLQDLLQRAINATDREDILAQDLEDFQTEAGVLNDLVNMFEMNVTQTEENIGNLSLQANRTQALFNDLERIIRSLDVRVRVELRAQLLEATMLNEQLQREFSVLVRLTNEANEVSLDQILIATNLLQQATTTLSNATTSLQLLQQAIDLQDQTVVIVEMIRNETLPRLDGLYSEGVAALTSAQISVPIALENATRILETILNISIPEYNVELRREQLEQLRIETIILFNSTSQLGSELDFLQANFSSYNATAFNLISESEALNNEATNLLLIAEGALHFANDSVVSGNAVIDEANRLLAELQERFIEAQNFTDGLEGVIRNIELAENQSLVAENETITRARELMEVMFAINRAASLLEEASVTLRNAFEIAMEANSTANQLLSQATALNNSATTFAGDVSMAADDVDALDQAVMDDTEAISMVSGTANETILAAANLSARLIVIKDTLANLTLDLDAISLLRPDLIQDINSTLVSMEQESVSNQILVDSLSAQVMQLQESADELRARYTQVQQHRDLLGDILRNVEELNCRQQFEN